MTRLLGLLTISTIVSATCLAETIVINPCGGDDTRPLQHVIDNIQTFGSAPVTIMLTPGQYHISRSQSSKHLYHISNTASAEEKPDPMKHIGLWFHGLKNVTLDGNGATIVTHGEMTSFVIDSCENVVLKNFTLTAADPSVPEMKVMERTDTSLTCSITSPSRFEIADGEFAWIGEGWKFGRGAHNGLEELAQVFYPERNVTLRCASPIRDAKRVELIGDNLVKFVYDSAPQEVNVGEVYQMRHGIRNEACGFINLSLDVALENVEFNFMGNFGLVGQMSENLTYDNIRCRPAVGSQRTNAGFADFVQMSGCKGKIKITNSHFEGAHDDPINIHGTHLKCLSLTAPDRLTVRYMHGQTFGFYPAFEGDSVELVNRHTLLCHDKAQVKDVERIDDYTYSLTLDHDVDSLPNGLEWDDLAIENITYTPEVIISNNFFARTPTRAILITTRGRSVIEGNTFFRIPMPSILVSDDARGWYESGPMRDLTIRKNRFVECSEPVIAVWPELNSYAGPVHSGIKIVDNQFDVSAGKAISLRGCKDITVSDNTFRLSGDGHQTIGDLIETDRVNDLEIAGNKID